MQDLNAQTSLHPVVNVILFHEDSYYCEWLYPYLEMNL